MLLHHTENPGCRVFDGESKGLSHFVAHRLTSCIDIELKLDTGRKARPQAAEHQTGIHECRTSAAPTIASRPRIGASACMPDVQHPRAVNDGNGAAHRAHGKNV